MITFRPKLRTVLLSLNLLVLLLPLGGIAALRLYESELVRQTEVELISQASLTAAMFRDIYLKQSLPATGKSERPTLPSPLLAPSPAETAEPDLAPIPPRLDLAASRVRDPAPPAEQPKVSPDPLALNAGRELNSVLADARRTVLSGVRIVDCNGIVVASSNAELGLSLAAREEVGRALAGQQASLLRVRTSRWDTPALASISRGAGVRVFVAQPVLAGERVIGAVIASRTPLDAAKALFQIRGHLLKGSLVLLLVVLLMASLTAYYINRPVRALIDQANRLKNGESGGDEPLRNPGIQEVEQLSTAIADMATTLAQRSAYITTFATNVSHEFKTPLTSIHGAVEILKDHFSTMGRDERENFLGIIDSETGRLERLVRRLLDLARADTFTVGSESCDAAAALESMADHFRHRGVTVDLTCPGTPVRLGMGRETFETVVANLLENARLHGGPGVRVHISAELLKHDGVEILELVISDNGPGISPGNRDRIFRQFFTTARERGGSGLGLSIVQSLLRAHGGTITLDASAAGAQFRIQIPCAARSL